MRQILVVVALTTVGVGAGAGGASGREPVAPKRVSDVQRATVPVLRQAAARSVPRLLRFAAKRLPSSGFAPNPDLARKVVPPGRRKPWYVIPANRAVCLFTEENGVTCVTDRDVRAGKLWIALIKPTGPLNPLPPTGDPVPATIVGVAPEGVTAISATTASGAPATGAVKNGMFSLAATDITALHLHRPPTLDVVIPDFNDRR